MRAIAVARAALAEERAAPKGPRRSRDELAFLPAALEIVETPPSPGARFLIWTLSAFFVIALAWAWFSHVDVVAVGQGRLVSSGRSKIIQPVEIGVVRAIHVRDGMKVRQGDVLIELDPTGTAAERERLAQELLTARVTGARMRAALSSSAPEQAQREFVAPPGAGAELVATQRRLLVSELEELRARLRQLDDEAERRRADRAAIAGAIRRLDEAIPLLREREKARGDLAEKGYGSRLQYLEIKQQLVEHEQERNIQRHRLEQAEAALAALDSQRQQIMAEFRRNKTGELNEAERKAATIAQELVKAEQRNELQTLTTPIDGVVQQLAVHTIGGVVTAAQQLMVIVPAEDALEVEATILNKDIGFVRVGQAAEVKLETFNFTRYGTIPAEVVSISGDAIIDEERGPVYAARVRLSRMRMDIDGQKINMAPGMNATVEIKTDQRRVIGYLLSPLLRYRQESLRER